MMRIVAFDYTKRAGDGRVEMPAKRVNPVARFARSAMVLLLVIVAGASFGGHVEFGFVRPVVENGRVIAAMKIGVCFYIEMLGKKPAAITQSCRKEVGRTRAAAGPGLEPRLEPGGEADREHEQHRRN